MASKTKVTKPVVPEVSNDELIAAAVNAPTNTVSIAGKEFQLKDFKYKDYIVFVKYLAPMMDLFLTGGQRLNSLENESKFNAMSVINFCADTLPQMGLMIAHHTYPDMTEEELLDIVPSPFELAELVLAQIAHNHIIEKMSGFLQLLTPKRMM